MILRIKFFVKLLWGVVSVNSGAGKPGSIVSVCIMGRVYVFYFIILVLRHVRLVTLKSPNGELCVIGLSMQL